jgi:hypothetical protein
VSGYIPIATTPNSTKLSPDNPTQLCTFRDTTL